MLKEVANNIQNEESSHNVKVGSYGILNKTYGFKLYANCDKDEFIQKLSHSKGSIHDF